MLQIRDANNTILKEEQFADSLSYADFFDLLFSRINANQQIVAVAHRVVHGGEFYTKPVLVTPSVIQELKTLIPFAPLHQPFSLNAIETLQHLLPTLPQIACFDTAFHSTHPRIADLFALPRAYAEAGIRRYGFHGLSYEYIVKQLQETNTLKPKTIIAHLGNGASMCAVKNGKSYDSTMGFTALDGLMMGTRCGSIDPGVVLYCLKSKQMSYEQIENLLYKESGLLGVSALSSNMQTLLDSDSPEAREAVDLFVYRAKRELGGLIAALGGLDTLVFTGGIGENAPTIREAICEGMDWLSASVDIQVIPTDEEWIIAKHTFDLIAEGL